MAYDVITPVRMGQGSILVATNVFYTVPASTRAIVKNIDLANNSGSATSITVYLVPSGGVAGASNILIPGVIIKKNTMIQWHGSQIIDAGGTVQAKATIIGSSINISGGEAI